MVLNQATLVYIAPAVSSRPYAGWHEYAYSAQLRYRPPSSKLRAASSGAQPPIYNDVFHCVKQPLRGTHSDQI